MKKRDVKKIPNQKKWWDRLYTEYGQYIKKYLWNKKVTKETFVKDDFVDAIQQDIERLLKIIIVNAQQRDSLMLKYVQFNTVFITLYGLITLSKYFLASFFIFTIIYILSLLVCWLWYESISSLLNYNTICICAIIEYQKHLPAQPIGYAIQKTIQKTEKQGNRQIFILSLKAPYIYMLIHTLIYLYHIVNIFII